MSYKTSSVKFSVLFYGNECMNYGLMKFQNYNEKPIAFLYSGWVESFAEKNAIKLK